MARAIWNGTIGFGLVQIPVSLHAAEEQHELDMTLLDRRDFSPVGYERVSKKSGKEVPWEQIVKGYEHAPGKYVVLTDADFEAANVKATHSMDITDFVEFTAVDPRYIERPYYLVPQKGGTKAYALLRETLRRTGKAAIGKIVIRTRQHLAAVVPHDKALLLELLRFPDELRDASDLELPDTNLSRLGVSSKEVSMAEKLVEGMVGEFEPEKYEDEYRRDLMALIRKKAKAGELNELPTGRAKKAPKPEGAKVIDLSALLAQSLGSRAKGSPARAGNGKSPGPAKAHGKRRAHAARRKSA